MWGRMLAVIAAVSLGCASPPARVGSPARCGPDGHPASDYIRYQPASCPARPTVGTACTLGPDALCNYLAPERGPCEFDSCSCRAEGSGSATWSCGRAVE